MHARRTVVSLAGCATLALVPVLVPGAAQAAAGAPTVALSIDPTHGTPGASVTGTITVANCTAPSFVLDESYVDVNGDPATATPAGTPVVTSDPNVYTVSITVPADAARSDLSEKPVTVTVTATCTTETASPSPLPTVDATPTAGPLVVRATAHAARSAALTAALTANQAQASGTILVDALAAAVITADPKRVKLGTPFTFTLSGCVGGLADLYVLDGAGNDFTVADADVTQTSDTAYKGTFTIPKTAKVGDGGIVADCAQAASASAGVAFFTSPSATGAGAGSGAGSGAGDVPTAVPADPHLTG